MAVRLLTSHASDAGAERWDGDRQRHRQEHNLVRKVGDFPWYKSTRVSVLFRSTVVRWWEAVMVVVLAYYGTSPQYYHPMSVLGAGVQVQPRQKEKHLTRKQVRSPYYLYQERGLMHLISPCELTDLVPSSGESTRTLRALGSSPPGSTIAYISTGHVVAHSLFQYQTR